ncbi:MAG: hypothetical protein JWO03_4078 [Bacteroidetes bacterium]|nr:hypothetical protein [Bacteroidota bacterium]
MKTYITLIIFIVISGQAEAGCGIQPQYCYFKPIAGPYLYDSTTGVYYKHPRDTLYSQVYIEASCAQDTWYYNDSVIPTHSLNPFDLITKSGRYTLSVGSEYYGPFTFGFELRDTVDASDLSGTLDTLDTRISDIDTSIQRISLQDNPISNHIHLMANMHASKNIDYCIFSIDGMLLQSGTKSCGFGDNHIEIEAQAISAGNYILILYDTNTMMETKKIRITKL